MPGCGCNKSRTNIAGRSVDSNFRRNTKEKIKMVFKSKISSGINSRISSRIESNPKINSASRMNSTMSRNFARKTISKLIKAPKQTLSNVDTQSSNTENIDNLSFSFVEEKSIIEKPHFLESEQLPDNNIESIVFSEEIVVAAINHEKLLISLESTIPEEITKVAVVAEKAEKEKAEKEKAEKEKAEKAEKEKAEKEKAVAAEVVKARAAEVIRIRAEEAAKAEEVAKKNAEAQKLKFIPTSECAEDLIQDSAKKQKILWGSSDPQLKPYKIKNKPLLPSDFEKLMTQHDWFIVVRNPYEKVLADFCSTTGGIGISKSRLNVKQMNQFIINNINKRGKINNYYVEQNRFVDSNPDVKTHILKFENLENEFRDLMKKYELDIVLALKPEVAKKTSVVTSYQISDFSQQTIDLINKVYDKDFEMFEYKKIDGLVNQSTK